MFDLLALWDDVRHTFEEVRGTPPASPVSAPRVAAMTTRWLHSPTISTVLHAFENHRADGGSGWASLCGRPEANRGTEVGDDGRCLACVQILGERGCSDT